MRLDGFHVIWHPQLGIYLGEAEPEPEFSGLSFARYVWSSYPNLLLSAPAYRNEQEAQSDAQDLFGDWELRPVRADLVIQGRVFASMQACLASGLPPWIAAHDYLSESYCRTEAVGPLLTAIGRKLERYDDSVQIEWRRASGGLHWSIHPRDMTKTRRAVSARNRAGVLRYRV